MSKIEGTYWNVKSQEFVDFYTHLGVPKEKTQKALGTHWSLKLWKDGDLWGCHITCKELPYLNSLDTAVEGVEKHFEHPLVGGKAKMTCKRDGNKITTITESEKFGKMVGEEVYTDEGLHWTLTCQGKTVKEFWERCVKVDGAYIFDQGENIEGYFKAIGVDDPHMSAHLKHYKMHICKKGNNFWCKEWFGDKTVCNKTTLDVEGPFRYPDDDGETPKRRAVFTKTGVGKYTALVKSPNGLTEEWTYSFCDNGLCLTGTEKRTNQTCKFHFKRFHDMSGTFKIVSMPGFEKFASCMGMPDHLIQDMITDTTARFKVCDMGNGCHRHQMISKNFTSDLSFKLDHEFVFYHPIMKENVKAVATQTGCTFTMTVQTSKGTIVNTTHVNETFSVMSVCHKGSRTGYKKILERECSWH